MTCGLQAHQQPAVPLHRGHQWAWCQAPALGASLTNPRTRVYWERWLEACDGGAAEEALALRHAPAKL